MALSDYAIIIGGPLVVCTVAALLAWYKRSWTGVLVAGAIVCGMAWRLNRAWPPMGAAALYVLFAIAFLGTMLSVWRDRQSSAPE